MLINSDEIAAQFALQEELTLQYEALREEMERAPREKRFEYVQLISDHVRRLSQTTRSTALNIRYGNL